MPELRLYNSLTRKKEVFQPLDPAHVRLYACGPTVYNYAHIGNARMAVVFDLLSRVLRQTYPKVTYVSNITDVDDKIIEAARLTGEPIAAITEKYTQIYNDDMAALGCAEPDVQPRATAYIPQMIALIADLIAKGHAYASNGHVLFHVPSFPAYGGLSGRSRDEQIAGARVEVASYKKDPADFILWKPSSGDEPGWDSPFGFGRPGWHIECSAMAGDILKLPFDIHGGGADLKFPHHENEIAQSCCAHGDINDLSSFAKTWVHNGFVTVEGEKMSKSLGNFTLVRDLLKKYDGEVIRLTLLSSHYRQPLDLSENVLNQNKRILEKLYNSMLSAQKNESCKDDDGYIYQDFFSALTDDLNTPLAIRNLQLKRGDGVDTITNWKSLKKTGALMGILQSDPEEWLGYKSSETDNSKVELLLSERNQAKQSKNFARADEIRNELTALGIIIEDTPQGTIWRKG
jgi:cysteinyl-tRNA synthetase